MNLKTYMKKVRESSINVAKIIIYIYGRKRTGPGRHVMSVELVSRNPKLLEGERHQLYVCFKTKFRNRILDYIRKQESHKRRFDKEPYEEVRVRLAIV